MPLGPIGPVGVDALALYRSLPIYQPLPEIGAAGPGGPAGAPAAAGVEGTSFRDLVADRLGAALELERAGGVAAQQLATGQAEDISAATIAIEKATISSQLVATIRNKAIEAYQDVMRMQI